jgi:hypothetical protein
VQFNPASSPLTFIPFFALVYCAALFLVSCFGWRQLASRFGTTKTIPPGSRFRGVSGWVFPLARYNSCLVVVLASQGIYVVPDFFVRLFHRAMLFPWSCVTFERQDGFFCPYIRMTISAGKMRFQLRLPIRAESEIRHLHSNATQLA